jgi:hypothetical protein
MVNAALPDIDDIASEVTEGRRFGYVVTGDWVLMCPDLSDRAVRIYSLLKMHCGRGRDATWVSQATLAEMIGIKTAETVGRAIQELVAVGAVSVETVTHRAGRRNVYTVHETPPDGYNAGPADRAQYYADRPGRLVADPDGGTSGNRGRRNPKRRTQVELTQGRVQSAEPTASRGRARDFAEPGCVQGQDDPDDWIRDRVDDYDPGEESMVFSLLNRGRHPQRVVNTILQHRTAQLA